MHAQTTLGMISCGVELGIPRPFNGCLRSRATVSTDVRDCCALLWFPKSLVPSTDSRDHSRFANSRPGRYTSAGHIVETQVTAVSLESTLKSVTGLLHDSKHEVLMASLVLAGLASWPAVAGADSREHSRFCGSKRPFFASLVYSP